MRLSPLQTEAIVTSPAWLAGFAARLARLQDTTGDKLLPAVPQRGLV